MPRNTGRYEVSADEDFEPGSNGAVLKNFYGITSQSKIEALEGFELNRVEKELIETIEPDHKFTSKDICNIHKMWLGDIYPSAGKYRSVSMSKGGFLFAVPNLIDSLMKNFEKKYLRKYTPCSTQDTEELALALAIVHLEFILIHPFREGNGRVARLLSDLMVMQAGREPLNYLPISHERNQEGFKNYILAIHVGVSEDYGPIKKIFKKLLELKR